MVITNSIIPDSAYLKITCPVFVEMLKLHGVDRV